MNQNLILEHYPDIIQAKIERRNRRQSQEAPNYINGYASSLVFEDLKLWRVDPINVSFKGGTTELHRKIANAANEWTKYGNMRFDFGYNTQTDSYRKWHPSDNSHIRVGFEYRGYWSLIGNDSRNPQIVDPGDITLNLFNFDRGLPYNWQAVVLHEFGHALGFHHEHQSPDAKCDFDWPKLYEHLGDSPNFWPKSRVDQNLKQLSFSGMTFSAHDKHSIMHYSFPSWMFIQKEQSKCFTSENTTLSVQDKEMMKRAYPYDEQQIAAMDAQRIQNLESVLACNTISQEAKSFHQEHLAYYRNT